MAIPVHTFPGRIGIGSIALMVLLAVATFYLMWHGGGVAIAAVLLLMVVVVERMIHTEYRIDRERLVVHCGRFSRDRVVELPMICRIERINRLRIGRRALYSYLVVVTTDGREVVVTPRNEDEFVNTLSAMRTKQQRSNKV